MILVRYLGVDEFGTYAVVFSVVNLVVPLTHMGIQEIGIREMARENDVTKKGACLGSLLQARLLLLTVAGLIIAIVLIAMWPKMRIVYGVLIFYVAIVLGTSGELVTSAFIADERFQYNLLSSFLERISLLILIGLVALADLGFYAIFVSYVISKGIKTASALYLLKKYFYRIIFEFDARWIKKIIRESYLVGLGISTSLGFHHATVIILQQVADNASAGIFTAYYNVIARCQLLSVAFSRSLMPGISMGAKRNPAAFAKLSRKGLLTIFLAGVFLAIAMWPLKGLIIKILYGEEFMVGLRGMGYLILLVPFLFADNILNVSVISKGMARHFFLSKASGFIAGLGITFFLALSGYRYDAGIYGIILGKLAATTILFTVFVKITTVDGNGTENPATG